jgi:hypothetical protein
MQEFKSKKEKAQINLSVTFYLEEGYDAQKDRKAMNAVKLEIKE